MALADGAAAPALNVLRSAWSTWCDLEVPYEAARARVLIGLACRELGDEETAEMDLRAARRVFVDLGAASDVARVDELLAPTASTATGGALASPLTGREVEVLQLVAAGKTNRQIAETLVISEKTVARHISNIFVKINVSSRSAATGYAYQHGLT
jgi:DNA-binding NarL/FixJ family response regulator